LSVIKVLLLALWNPDSEVGTLPHITLQGDRSIMGVNDVLDDVEPKTQTLSFPGRNALEAMKDSLLILRTNSGTIISDVGERGSWHC
jgi:hypothetical protein